MSDQNTQDQNELSDADLEQAAGGHNITGHYTGGIGRPVGDLPVGDKPKVPGVPPGEATTNPVRPGDSTGLVTGF